MNVARPYATPNVEPPQWVQEFPRPACFTDPRDWSSWLEGMRLSAKGAELKAMQRGQCPSPCPDCMPNSGHRSRAVRAGTCIPIVPVEQHDADGPD